MRGFNQVTVWSGELKEKLVELNGEAMSSAQIAKKINALFNQRFTRSAIIGARHRLGLTIPERSTWTDEHRRAYTRYGDRSAKPKDSQRGKWSRVRLAAVPLEYMDAPSIEDMAIPFAQRETIAGLTNKNCHWPVGDPSSVDFFFCGGAAVKDKPYCSGHCKVAYGKSVSPNPKTFRLPQWGTTA